MKILILGTRSPIAIDLAKCFLKQNIEVHFADVFRPYIGRNLISNKNFHFYPSPKNDNANFEIAAIEIVKKLAPNLIIPLNEEVFYWSKLAKKIEMPLFAPEFSTLLMLHSKLEFNKIIKKIGANAPKTQIAKPKQNGAGLVFKREFSRFGEYVEICPQIAKFDEFRNNPMLAQEYIEGIDYSFYALAKNGEILLFSTYSSAWRNKGGAALCFEPAFKDISQKAFEIAQKLAAKLSLSGQFSCDFRIDNEGNLWFLECNPRATSGIHNLVHDKDKICDAFVNVRAQNIKPEASKISIAMLFFGLLNAIRTKTMEKFWHDFNSSRDVLKGQNIAAFFDFIIYGFKAFMLQISLSQILTHDIEYNGD